MHGASYQMGRGVPMDDRKAAALYRVSCRMGYPSASGELVRRGEGLPMPIERGLPMLEGLCKQGGLQEA